MKKSFIIVVFVFILLTPTFMNLEPKAEAELATTQNVSEGSQSSEMITATGTLSGIYRGGVGNHYTSVSLTFNIYGGVATGSLHSRQDIIWENVTDQTCHIIGFLYLNFQLSGSYLGGLSGDISDGRITGTGNGNKDGPFSVSASGTWSAHIDGLAGTIDFKSDFKITGGPTSIEHYPDIADRTLYFTPPPIIGSINVYAVPETVGAPVPGDYQTTILVEVLDTGGDIISGRRLDFSVEPSVVGSLFWLDLFQGTTDGAGSVRNKLSCRVDNTSILPLICKVLVKDILSSASGSIDVKFQVTTLEVAIEDVSPSTNKISEKEWEVTADLVTISGHLKAGDPTKVILRVSCNGTDYGLPSRPELKADGSFSFWMCLVTQEDWYEVTVVATDEQGNSHSSTISIHFIGKWELEILEVSAPRIVDPGSEYKVEVKIHYIVPISTTLTVALTQLPGETVVSKNDWTLVPGEQTITVNLAVTAPSAPTVSTVSTSDSSAEQLMSYLAAAPNPGRTEDLIAQTTYNEEFTQMLEASALFPNGASATGQVIGVMISTIMLGESVLLYRKLPIPWEGEYLGIPYETKQWSDLGRDGVAYLAWKEMVYPEWIQAVGVNITIEFFQWGDIDFDVTDLKLYVDGPPAQPPISPIPPDFLQGGKVMAHRASDWQVISNWGKNWVPAAGTYIIRAEYTINYTVNGINIWKTGVTLSRPFHVLPKRTNPFSVKDFYTTILEFSKVTSKINEPNTLNLQGQGDMSVLTLSSPSAAQPIPVSAKGQSLTASILPVVANQAGNPYRLRITLDWADQNADIDLHLIDPNNCIIGYDYGRGVVRNTIIGANYSGPNVKPEWVEIDQMAEGTYILTAYVVYADGPISATLTADIPGYSKPKIAVANHVLCKGLGSDGTPIEVTSTFTPTDQVFHVLSLTNASKGDAVDWVFSSASGIVSEMNCTLDWEGEGYCYAVLNLGEYELAEAEGDWTVSIYVNNNWAVTDQYTVQSVEGNTGWGQITVLLPIAIVAVVVIVVILAVLLLIRSRKSSPMPPPPPPQSSSQP